MQPMSKYQYYYQITYMQHIHDKRLFVISTHSRRSNNTYYGELGRRVNEHGGQKKDKDIQCFHHQTQVKEGLPTVPEKRQAMGLMLDAPSRYIQKKIINVRSSEAAYQTFQYVYFSFFVFFLMPPLHLPY